MQIFKLKIQKKIENRRKYVVDIFLPGCLKI